MFDYRRKTMLCLQMMEQVMEMVIVKRLHIAASATNKVMMGGVTGDFVDSHAVNLGRHHQLQFAKELDRPVDRCPVNRRGFGLHLLIEFGNGGVAAELTQRVENNLPLWGQTVAVFAYASGEIKGIV